MSQGQRSRPCSQRLPNARQIRKQIQAQNNRLIGRHIMKHKDKSAHDALHESENDSQNTSQNDLCDIPWFGRRNVNLENKSEGNLQHQSQDSCVGRHPTPGDPLQAQTLWRTVSAASLHKGQHSSTSPSAWHKEACVHTALFATKRNTTFSSSVS